MRFINPTNSEFDVGAAGPRSCHKIGVVLGFGYSWSERARGDALKEPAFPATRVAFRSDRNETMPDRYDPKLSVRPARRTEDGRPVLRPGSLGRTRENRLRPRALRSAAFRRRARPCPAPPAARARRRARSRGGTPQRSAGVVRGDSRAARKRRRRRSRRRVFARAAAPAAVAAAPGRGLAAARRRSPSPSRRRSAQRRSPSTSARPSRKASSPRRRRRRVPNRRSRISRPRAGRPPCRAASCRRAFRPHRRVPSRRRAFRLRPALRGEPVQPRLDRPAPPAAPPDKPSLLRRVVGPPRSDRGNLPVRPLSPGDIPRPAELPAPPRAGAPKAGRAEPPALPSRFAPPPRPACRRAAHRLPLPSRRSIRSPRTISISPILPARLRDPSRTSSPSTILMPRPTGRTTNCRPSPRTSSRASSAAARAASSR